MLTMRAALAALIGIGLCACAPGTARTNDEPGPSGSVVQPTMPAVVPGYLEVDPETGLHMTGTPTVVDIKTFRLNINGKVDNELSLTYDELLLLPEMTATAVLECEGYFTDTATWSGVSLKELLDMAGVQSDAGKIIIRSADGYKTTLSLEEAAAPGNFLAYELEDETLPVLHGFPLRAVFPGLTGYYWAKWVQEIVVE
ncbi:MAG: molybdopterin-dependent oxidoreductase [Clostridiales bacterium]|jgi:DMSO/TMAO reductase YedYZ molybdopterin-dependent catalytic subunit|nr:molybdopterin-dependent oxidoreductase [Clostridiales bacterium]